MSDLLFRPLQADEFPLFHHYGPVPASGVGLRPRPFEELGYRSGWVWIASRGDKVVARAAFWAPEGSDRPAFLDWFDPGHGDDRVETGAALLEAALAVLMSEGDTRPEYHLFLPVGWQEQPDALADATDRIDAAERLGWRRTVERLNLRWLPEYGLPPRSARLTFTPADDDETVLGLLARVAGASLDSWDRRTSAEKGAEATAREILTALAGYPGGRSRWRLAHDASGALVGVVMPTRNDSSATVGYVGVDPAHRGHGYSGDLVTEALHIFAAEGEPQVYDNTDLGNVPMAASFARLGYRVTGHRMVLT